MTIGNHRAKLWVINKLKMPMIQLELLKDQKVATTYTLDAAVYTLGRSEENDIVIEHPKVSRVHAKLRKTDEGYILQDMNSTNYVFVNGHRIKEKQLEHQDKIQISSDVSFQYKVSEVTNQPSPFAQTQVDLQKNFIHKDELLHLQKVTHAIASVNALSETLATILKEGLALTHAERGVIVPLSYEGEPQWDQAHTQDIPLSPTAQPIGISQSIFDEAKSTQKVVVKMSDVSQQAPTQSMMSLKIYSVMCAPLVYRSKVLGLFYVDAQKMPNNFTESDQTLFHFLSDQAAVAIANSRRFHKLQRDVEQLKLTQKSLMHKIKHTDPDEAPLKEHTYSAGGIVLTPTRKILVVKQSNQTWSLPKGRVEVGEEMAVAAMREIYEETGVAFLHLIKKLPEYSRSGMNAQGIPDDAIQKTIQMYLFRAQEGPLKPRDPENPEARWVPLKEAFELLSHPEDKTYLKTQIQALKK